jgi:hypothetical protein
MTCGLPTPEEPAMNSIFRTAALRPDVLYRPALLVFAWLALGADDCALTQIGQPVPPASSPGQKPLCLTDPPVGCYGVCNVLSTGAIYFTPECSDVSANARGKTLAFEDDATNAAADPANPLCNPADGPTLIGPCAFGDAPVQVELSDACMPAPPPSGC